MGKASRAKASRRQARIDGVAPSMNELERRARKADARGRQVGDQIADWERVAADGPDRMAEALIARHTLRMDRIRCTSDYDRLFTMGALAPITALDQALMVEFGASPTRPPAAYVGSWADHLAWGVDSAVATIRLLLCGQVVGAACIARNQLERWTSLRATNAGLTQEAGENITNFVARVWSADDRFHSEWFSVDASEGEVDEDDDVSTEEDLTVEHRHIVMSDGNWICPPLLYVYLSELIHGRELINAIAWDSADIFNSRERPDDLTFATGIVVQAVTLCLRELRIAAAGMAEDAGNDKLAALLRSTLDGFSDRDFDPRAHAESMAAVAREHGDVARR